MARGPQVGLLRHVGGESDRVIDGAVLHFAVAQQARQDRKACGVRRRPTGGAKRVALERPGCARPSGPATGRRLAGVEQLVEAACAGVDDYLVTVTCVLASALDLRI